MGKSKSITNIAERKFATELDETESIGVKLQRDQFKIVGHLPAVCEAVDDLIEIISHKLRSFGRSLYVSRGERGFFGAYILSSKN